MKKVIILESKRPSDLQEKTNSWLKQNDHLDIISIDMETLANGGYVYFFMLITYEQKGI